jgi:hypothetical protein
LRGKFLSRFAGCEFLAKLWAVGKARGNSVATRLGRLFSALAADLQGL